MTKILSALVAALLALGAVGVQAASHAGGAPMKASEAGAKKHDTKKHDGKKEEKKEEKK